MKITVFTSNQSRHLGLIDSLAGIADEVFAVQECTTAFPGEVEDFYRRSEVMQKYFSRVIEAERLVFGGPHFLPGNVHQLALKMGDLSRLPLENLKPALTADLFVVFGSSYIRGALIEKLIERDAINIHMGTSPYYRGSSCNFWALYDGRPEYVGATIHHLSTGLDSGDMLFHTFPAEAASDPFVYGMQAVRSAHLGLCRHIADGSLLQLPSVKQDRSLELRYSRNSDFTDAAASAYLNNLPAKVQLRAAIDGRDMSLFINPYFG
jgi:hypothetical protein